jgi:uncharacterized glyoxalase superfamily protein PhnB
MTLAGSSTAKVVTAIRYRDIERAADWLQAAFGFERRAGVPGDDGRAAMVQLTYGDHLIMLLPVGGSELDTIMRQPDEIGGAATQSCYLVVADVERHHNHAKATGAGIVSALKAVDKGGYGYTCRDLEGHLWSFGSYDPWSEAPIPSAPSPALFTGRRFAVPASLAAMAGAVALIGVAWGLWHASIQSTAAEDGLLARLSLAHEKADQAHDLAARKTADLARERAAKKLIALDALRAQHQLALERGARETAEKLLQQSEINSAAERSAKLAASETAAAAEQAAARERAQKSAAEQAAAAARQELTLVHSARLKAERSAKEVAEQLAGERATRAAAEQAATLANAARLKAERAAKDAAEQLARERAAREAAENLAKQAQDKVELPQPAAPRAAKAPRPPPATTKKAANAPKASAPAQPLPALVP